MRERYDIVIGIDPDVDKSGLAVVGRDASDAKRLLDVTTLPFPQLIERCWQENEQAVINAKRLVVLVEAGWLNRSNWHLPRTATNAMAAAIGNAAGRNHETGRKIVEMLRHAGIETREVRPLALTGRGFHIWNGKDGKCTADEFRHLTSWPKRTNQEGRDAGLIAWSF